MAGGEAGIDSMCVQSEFSHADRRVFAVWMLQDGTTKSVLARSWHTV